MTGGKPNLHNPFGQDYNKAHTYADDRGVAVDKVKAFGQVIADLHYAGVNGRFPAKATRRPLKEGQLFAIGALSLHAFNHQRDIFKDLPMDGQVANALCSDVCPHRSLQSGETVNPLLPSVALPPDTASDSPLR